MRPRVPMVRQQGPDLDQVHAAEPALLGRWRVSAGLQADWHTQAGNSPPGLFPVPLGPLEGVGDQFAATTLMRAIISSTALSTGTFSLSTRFMALAQTFSLFSTVNL